MRLSRIMSLGWGVMAVVGLLLGTAPLTAAGPGRELDRKTGPVWSTVSDRGDGTCGIRLDHSLWCWGLNDFGQLGLGGTTARHFPVRVGTGRNWLRLIAGHNHTCGMRTDDSLWCWGRNAYGDLGLGDTVERHIPTRVGTGFNWVTISVGHDHTCGIRSDRSL